MIKITIKKRKGNVLGEKMITGRTTGFSYMIHNGKRRLLRKMEVI